MPSSPGRRRACAAGNGRSTPSIEIVAAVDEVLRRAPAEGDIAIVTHGGVGALLLCHLQGRPISRAADQPAGQGGHHYAFAVEDRRLLHGWLSIDAVAPDGAPMR